MRTCDETLALISAALDGTLTTEEQTALNEHLAHCPACSALYTDLSELHIACSELEEIPAPDGFVDRVMAHIAADPAQNQPNNVIPISAKKKSYSHWKRWVASAAAVVIVVAGAAALPEFAHKSNDGLDFAAANFSKAESALADQAAPECVMEEEAIDSSTYGYTGATQQDGAETVVTVETAPAADAEPSEQADGKFADFASYCGVLTLDHTSLPEGLEQFESAEDEQGSLTYVVPAEYFYSVLSAMQSENKAVSSAPNDTDPHAEYGLIIVEKPS